VRLFFYVTKCDIRKLYSQTRLYSNISDGYAVILTFILSKVSQNGPVTTVPPELIESKVYLIRGKRVMLDRDLAMLYDVPTKALNQAVRRNQARFPDDFMFVLSPSEGLNLKSQFVTSSWGGKRKATKAFTEQGVAMLSSVLKSERVIQVNIQIMRTFTKLRELLATDRGLKEKIEQIEQKYDSRFKVVFDAIKLLVAEDDKPKGKFGF